MSYPVAFITAVIPDSDFPVPAVTITCPICGSEETHENYIHGLHWRDARCGLGPLEILPPPGDELIASALA